MQPATIATPEGAYPGMIQDISEAKNLDEVIEMVPALGQEVVAAPASFVWDDELTDVPNHQVLVNKETGRPYAISSKKYGIIQHRDALAICEGMTDYSFNQAGVLSDGGTVWVSMRTDSQVVKQYDGQDDEIVPGILALSDHTLTSADLVLNSCTRLFCNNQIPSVKRNHEARFSISHRSQIVERMKKAAEIARTSLFSSAETLKVFQQLADTDFSLDRFRTFAEQLLTTHRGESLRPRHEGATGHRESAMKGNPGFISSARRQKDLDELTEYFVGGNQGAGPTAWGAYQSVTGWLDHQAERLEEGKVTRAKLERIWRSNNTGRNAALKDLAFRHLEARFAPGA